ncbi:MAG TPA: cellulase family glycosylhydrolase [Thermoleophilaceae bacterium]|nr:cellulase family glycosylhydrolase [Thermoleophilaceae bacterium]
MEALGRESVRVVACLAAAAVAALLAATSAQGRSAVLDPSGRWLTDSSGRVVVLHGVAVMNFNPPHLPAVQGFSADDADFLAAHGFNIVRVGFNWSHLEPRPGAVSSRYLASLRRTVRTLARRGIWSLLDLHQDGYGPAVHGDGAPGWATVTNGFPNPDLGFGANYLGNAAVNRAFDNLWYDAAGPGGVGLQARYAHMLTSLARAFRGERGVLGYELLNEPWPGSQYPSCANPEGCPAFDAQLSAFYRRMIAAVRRADPRRIVFYEPNLLFDFGADTHLANASGGDRRTGFAFHDYCLGGGAGTALPNIPGTGPGCEVEETMVIDNAEAYSARERVPPLNTEWAATNDLSIVARMAGELDAGRIPWTYWLYCCDPDGYTLLVDGRKRPAGRNVVRGVLDVIDRPFPRRVAGTPTSWSWDPDARTFRLAYSTRAAGRSLRSRVTRVWAGRLHFRRGYRLRVTGARILSRPGARVIALRNRRGAARVTLTLRPR